MKSMICLLYTSDAADDLTRVDLGGRRIIKRNFIYNGPHKFSFAIQTHGSPTLRVCKFCLVPLSEKRHNRD